MAAWQSTRSMQRGAALLLAMMVLVAVTTVAAGMIWVQMRALQVEAAERARAQAGWILGGALDWARLILREDQRSGQQRNRLFDSLDEPWATPLAEARLSSFLAVDQSRNADEGDGLQAFISGGIADAQARLNLRGLVKPDGKPVPEQVAALDRLAALAGAPADTGTRIASALARTVTAVDNAAELPLKPHRFADLAWLGIEAALLQRLAPWADLLPMATHVNANTAPRAVLRAAIDGIDVGTAERLVQARQRRPFETMLELQALLPPGVTADPTRINVYSNWFEVWGRLRLEERVVEERSLVQRDGEKVSVRRRERRSWTAAEEAAR